MKKYFFGLTSCMLPILGYSAYWHARHDIVPGVSDVAGMFTGTRFEEIVLSFPFIALETLFWFLFVIATTYFMVTEEGVK